MSVKRSSSSKDSFGIFPEAQSRTTTTATTNGTMAMANINLLTPNNHNNNNNGPPPEDIDNEDEYCVYTYKGEPGSGAGNNGHGLGADLPSSFFTFDQGDNNPATSSSSTAINDENPSSSYMLKNGHGHANTNGTLHHTNPNGSVVTISGSRVINGLVGVSGNVYSPEMDFLEMDFDPGVPDYEEENETRSPGALVEEAVNNLLRTLSTSDSSPKSESSSVLSNSINNGDMTDGTGPSGRRDLPLPMPSTTRSSSTSSSSSNSSPSKKPCIKYEMSSNEGIVIESISACCESSPDDVEFSEEHESEAVLPSTSGSSAANINVPPLQLPCCSKSLLNMEPNSRPSNLLHGCYNSSRRNNVDDLKTRITKTIRTSSSNTSNSASLSASVSNISTSKLLSSPLLNSPITLKLVKSNTLPEIHPHTRSSPENLDHLEDSVQTATISFSIPVTKVVKPKQNSDYDIHIDAQSNDDSVELNIESVMIWSLEKAQSRSLTQIGKSACGATAVCNVLMALGFEGVSPDQVNQHVKTRLRKNDAEIPEYLFSRSVAGATHQDLINAIITMTKGEINGRFFHPSPGISPEVFSKWLFKWICKGAIPVATINPQIIANQPNDEIPDAWHHQMIFGTTSAGMVFLTNPIECQKSENLLPQLVSESKLLIRRQDISSRKTPTTDLRELGKHPDPRWKEMNVLGQVANIFLEEKPVFNGSSVARRLRTSHIQIPAAYVAGITLFMRTESPYYQDLQNASELK